MDKPSTKTGNPTGNGRTKSFPAPRHLATPTDLTPTEVQAVTEVVNTLTADVNALYVKTKNYHWHAQLELGLAHAARAAHRWAEAGEHYRKVVEQFPEDGGRAGSSLLGRSGQPQSQR